MIARDYTCLTVLVILAVFIWGRDLSWVSSLEDTLPIILAIPVFIWLGFPWTSSLKQATPSISGFMIMAVIFIMGIILDNTLLLTISWTGILWLWLSSRMGKDKMVSVNRLIILPVLAFPWLKLDGEFIGWWFRLSSAWITSETFTLMGFNVLHEGTRIIVQGLPVGIGQPCSGMNALQSMLIAGTALAYIHLGKTRYYWWNIIFLALMAWLANILRIMIICAVALTISPEFALGIFHTWGGWLVLLLMLCLTWGVFSLQATLWAKKPLII